MKIQVESAKEMPLAYVPNGALFTGTIDGGASLGPFIKIGSISEGTWVVARLEAMEGLVWCSTRPKDVNAIVRGYRRLAAQELIIREA